MVGLEAVGTNAHWGQLSDTVVTYSPTSRLATMLNFDYGRGDRVAGIPTPVFWTGIAGYVKYAFNDLYAVATRYEYHNDHDGFTTGTAQHVNEFTGTFQRTVAHHLITRLEFRRDFSNRPVFTKGTTPALGQNTMAVGLVYAFDSREMKLQSATRFGQWSWGLPICGDRGRGKNQPRTTSTHAAPPSFQGLGGNLTRRFGDEREHCR